MGTKTKPYFVVDACYSQNSIGRNIDCSTSFFGTNFRTGDDRPNFAQVIRDGGDATNSLNGVLYTVKVQPGLLLGRRLNMPGAIVQSSTYCGLGISWSDNEENYFPPGIQDESKAIARSRAWSKLSALQSGSFNGYTFLGEFSDTVKLLRSPLKQSIKLTQDLLSVKGKASVKDFGYLWLQYRFGILPLLSDMSEISKIINDKAEDCIRERYRFYGKASSSVTSKYQNGSPGFVVLCDGYADWIYESETIIRFGLQTNLLDTTSTLQSRALNTLDINKVLPAAWELVPWSFLIDYFVNIGSIIEASSESQSILSYSVESNITSVTKRTSVTKATSGWPEGFEILELTPKVITIKRREVKRQGGTLEIPPLTFTLPGSGVRLKNIAALLTKLL